MTVYERIEQLLMLLEDIPAVDANIDRIERAESLLMDTLRAGDVADPRIREFTERAIDVMTGVSARLELETATVQDFDRPDS